MVALLRSFRAAQAVARPALAVRPAARAFSVSAIRRGGAQPPELLYVFDNRPRSCYVLHADFFQWTWREGGRST